MPRYDPERPHRTSLRLRSYDYTSAAAYFVTICTRERQRFFTEPGLPTIVEDAWRELPGRFPTITSDAWVVMPNHIHGIVWLHPRTTGTPSNAAPSSTPQAFKHPHWDREAPALSEVIRSLKAVTSRRIRQQRPELNFGWQSNYYEHIIRNEKALQAIRRYIADNPINWHLDRFNADATEEGSVDGRNP